MRRSVSRSSRQVPLQVYECEKCKYLLKHLADRRFSAKYNYTCPSCKEMSSFVFLRENDPVKDWLSNQIRMKKQARRKKKASAAGKDQIAS